MTSRTISISAGFTCDVCGDGMRTSGHYPTGWFPMRLPLELVPGIAAQPGHMTELTGNASLIDVDTCEKCAAVIVDALSRRAEKR